MINVLELEASKGWGGQEKRTVRVVNGLDKSRFKVYYGVHKDSELMRRKSEVDAEFLELPIKKSYNIFDLIRTIKVIKKYGIDIISTHSGRDAWIGAIAGKLTGKKVVRVRHLQLSINSPLSYNLSDRVTAVCHSVAEHLVSRGVQKSKIDIIYSGRDMSLYTPKKCYDFRQEIGVTKDEILIGIVAVLREQKRHTLLLKALTKLPVNCKLVIIGDGPQEGNIKRTISDLELSDRVYMVGHREDVPQILPSLDVFVLPSIMEAIGGSAIEASACQLPVVVSRVGGLPEVVLEGQSGYVFEPDNVESLVEKLELLVESKERREMFGKKGREFVLETFNIERMIRETEEQYEGVCSKEVSTNVSL